VKPNKKKSLLYRKVNTKTWNVRHNSGLDFKYIRNTKKESREQVNGSMHGRKQRGLDYTPLFKFLLSKVGQKWDEVFSEAKSRLDKTEPIFWMISINESDKKEIIRCGETSYFSGMYVDDSGKLQLTNSELSVDDLQPQCACCTYTFNGKVFGNEFDIATKGYNALVKKRK